MEAVAEAVVNEGVNNCKEKGVHREQSGACNRKVHSWKEPYRLHTNTTGLERNGNSKAVWGALMLPVAVVSRAQSSKSLGARCLITPCKHMSTSKFRHKK